jgi:hypothetical protein
MDKIDEATKSFGYTVLEGYSQYSYFSAEMTFVPVDETSSKVEWIGKYEPVGDAGPPVYIKERAVLVFKTLERAALSSKTLSYSDVLDASIDAVWEACKHVNEWLPRALPEYFTSSTYVQGNGEPGSIRVAKLGPGMKITRADFSHKQPSCTLIIQVTQICHPIISTAQGTNSPGARIIKFDQSD